MSSHRFGRRDALRLGVIGSALALGHQVIVAPARAHGTQAKDQTGPLWSLAVDIEGLKALSASVCSVAIDPLLLDMRQGAVKELEGRMVIRANSTPQVRKDIQAWFAGAHSRNAPPLRDVKIVLTHREGGARTFHIVDGFPVRFSSVDITTVAEIDPCWETIEVRVTRVELA